MGRRNQRLPLRVGEVPPERPEQRLDGPQERLVPRDPRGVVAEDVLPHQDAGSGEEGAADLLPVVAPVAVVRQEDLVFRPQPARGEDLRRRVHGPALPPGGLDAQQF